MKERKQPTDGYSYRTAPFSLRAVGAPSLDLDARAVEVVAATELPVRMWDWEHGEIDEVLLVKGAVLPGSGQLPLLDTHSRYSTQDVVGSARHLRRADNQLFATAVLSNTPLGAEIFTKIAEGHITDVSIGYRVSDATVVPKGAKAVIGGRTWQGPVKVVTSWVPKELSVVPIGADEAATVRSEHPGDRISVQLPGTRQTNKETHMEMDKRMEALEGAVTKMGELLATWGERGADTPNAAPGDDADLDQLRRDEAARRAKVRKEELDRQRDVKSLCAQWEARGFDLGACESDMLQDGTSLTAAHQRVQDLVLAQIGKREADGLHFGAVAVTADERDKTRTASAEGLMLRASIAPNTVKDKDNEYQHLSLFELAKNRLRTFNQSVRGLGKLELFSRALSTSDFTAILADVANKGVLDGFENEVESYEAWVDITGRVNDFKPHVFARASEAPSFQAVNADGGEYQYGKMSDKKETVAVSDQGIIVPFTRAAMINDDLGALSDIREKLGVAAKRKYGDLVYAILTSNPTMGDGVALFDANTHKNYRAAGYVPSVAHLNYHAALMATQKDMQGAQNLNVRPQFFLHPWALKGTVDNLLVQTTPAAVGTASAAVVNPWSYLTPVPEARLDAASASAWYLAARKGKTVRLYTLDGQMTPVVETREGWITDGIEFKGRITAAAKAVDWAGLTKDTGTGGV